MSIVVPLSKHWVSGQEAALTPSQPRGCGRRHTNSQCHPATRQGAAQTWGLVLSTLQFSFSHTQHSGVSDLRESCRWTWPQSTLVLSLHFSVLLAWGKKRLNTVRSQWVTSLLSWVQSNFPKPSPIGLLVSFPCFSDHFQVTRQGL